MMKDENAEPTLSEFFLAWSKGHSAELRPGQRAFNLLVSMRPDLAEKIRSGPLDPFHDDQVLPSFFAFIIKEWREPHA